MTEDIASTTNRLPRSIGLEDVVDIETYVNTRQALHAVAELLLAGPAYAQEGDIRLVATPGGFGVWNQPGPRVDGTELVVGELRTALAGTLSSVAAAASITPRTLADVYQDVVSVSLDAPLEVDPASAEVLADAVNKGDAALKGFAPSAERVLWPEHFDIAITVDEVNYGVSPGDSFIAWPYAYVGPWSPVQGDFWNASFGAAREVSEFSDVAAIIEFFEQGRVAARG